MRSHSTLIDCLKVRLMPWHILRHWARLSDRIASWAEDTDIEGGDWSRDFWDASKDLPHRSSDRCTYLSAVSRR